MRKIKFTKFEFITKILLSVITLSIFCFMLFCENTILSWFGNKTFIKNITGDFQVSFLNVGQAECTLIRYKDLNFVIDAGRDSVAYEKLKEVCKGDIDCLILTHADSDHVGGAKQIFQNYNVKKLLRPKLLVEGEFENGFSYSTDTAYIETISSARNEKGCEISYIDSGEIYSNEEFIIEILYPSLSENLAEAESNDYSAVIRVEYKGYKYLFMADATSDIEKKLMQKYGDYLNCDVLKVAHHGSNESTTEEFLAKTSPSYSIISVGELGINNYGHAGEEIKTRLNNFGCTTYQTNEKGNIMFGENKDSNLVCYFTAPSLSYPLISVICGVILLLIWGIRLRVKEKNG